MTGSQPPPRGAPAPARRGAPRVRVRFRAHPDGQAGSAPYGARAPARRPAQGSVRVSGAGRLAERAAQPEWAMARPFENGRAVGKQKGEEGPRAPAIGARRGRCEMIDPHRRSAAERGRGARPGSTAGRVSRRGGARRQYTRMWMERNGRPKGYRLESHRTTGAELSRG
eukprot:scaffold14376_cov108-Isochrysis_galbana.AAC.5